VLVLSSMHPSGFFACRAEHPHPEPPAAADTGGAAPIDTVLNVQAAVFLLIPLCYLVRCITFIAKCEVPTVICLIGVWLHRW
jgi:hypothetical protein